MAAGFGFTLLGPVRAWRDGAEVDLGSPQQRAVLTVLLLRAGGHVSAGDLVGALWEGESPKSAVGTVRTYIYRLRRLLGEKLIGSAGSAYVLAPPGEALDVVRFRGLADRARRASAAGDAGAAALHLDEALGLWDGAPLAGIPGPFAESQRALLEELRLSAAQDRLDAYLALGRHVAATGELALLAREHPYRERLRALLMMALYRAGRQAEALAVYDETRKLFVAELGVDPGTDLRQLHLRILNADPALMHAPEAQQTAATGEPGAGTGLRPAGGMAGSPTTGPGRARQVLPAQLPADLPAFVGRQADVESVLAEPAGPEPARRPGTPGITVITGMAGIGKTTLAVHAAHLMADRFPDGQLYVDLRGYDQSGMALAPRDAMRQLLTALNTPPERIPAELAAQAGLYRSLLAGRRALIVLDNALNAAQVRPLLPGARGCHVLVTSRDQLRPLIAVEGARVTALCPLTRHDARESLARRLGTTRVQAEAAAAEQIITLCAGLPLALSVVAARAITHPDHPLTAIAAELAHSGSPLAAIADPDPAVDARASLTLSYRALSPDAARLLRLSSLHPGPDISLHAMASLAGIPAAQAAAGLDELERVSLLTQHQPWQFTCHDVVRAYAAELAAHDPEGDRRAARARMFDHYRQSAYLAMLMLTPNRSPVAVPGASVGVTVADLTEHEDALDWFAVTYPVLRSVLDQAAERGLPEYTWQLAWALDPFHDRQARWEDKITVHRAALAAAKQLGDPVLRAHSHRSLGDAFRLRGDLGRASAHFKLAHRLYGQLGSRDEQARNLHNLVAVFQDWDIPDQAMSYALLALELSEEIGNRPLRAVALNNLGWMYSNAGDQGRAINCGQRALALLEETDEVGLRAHVLRTLGQSHHRAADHELASAELSAALAIFREQRDLYEEAYTLRWLAIMLRAAGNLAAARFAWQRSLPVLSDLGENLPPFDAFAREDDSTRR